MIKDTVMKCEMVTAMHLKGFEHRKKEEKHILTPTRSASRGCTV